VTFFADRVGRHELRGDELCGRPHDARARGWLVIDRPSTIRGGCECRRGRGDERTDGDLDCGGGRSGRERVPAGRAAAGHRRGARLRARDQTQQPVDLGDLRGSVWVATSFSTRMADPMAALAKDIAATATLKTVKLVSFSAAPPTDTAGWMLLADSPKPCGAWCPKVPS
jgi:hypothetical protein